MSITAWRIVKPQHAAAAFTGEGARRFGGRWNSKGIAIIYTSGSVSLAALEMLVHLQSSELLRRYVVIPVTFEQDLIERLPRVRLPRHWRASPPPPALQDLGDAWVNSGASAVLEVPSALVETESNYLLNPSHHDFPAINIGPAKPFRFDPRLR